MNVHKNARLTPLGRERIVRQVASGQTPEAVAEAQASARGQFASGSIVIVAKDWRDCRIAHPGRIRFRGLSRRSADIPLCRLMIRRRHRVTSELSPLLGAKRK